MSLKSIVMYYIECDRCGFEDCNAENQESEYYARRAFGWNPDAEGRDICTQCREKEKPS